MENNDKANTNDNQADDAIDLTDEQTIDLFIEGLLNEKGVVPEGEQAHQDMFLDLKTRLLEQIDRSLVAALPDDKLEELSKIVAKDGEVAPEKVSEMVVEAGVNVDDVVGATMANFREVYLNNGAEPETE